METKQIKSSDEPLFEQCWALYVSAFPEIERRDWNYQSETMQQQDYRFDALVEGDMFVGFVAWWDFESLRYVEHFATSEALRGKGYGAKILMEFAQRADKPIILEVEHPECEMSRRRIGFYERLGFVLSPLQYAHPSYSLDCEDYVSLRIMSYPRLIDEAELRAFERDNFAKIHFRKYFKQ